MYGRVYRRGRGFGDAPACPAGPGPLAPGQSYCPVADAAAPCVPSGPLAPGEFYCSGAPSAGGGGTPGALCFAGPLFPWFGRSDLAGNCYDVLTLQGVQVPTVVAAGVTLFAGFLLVKALLR